MLLHPPRIWGIDAEPTVDARGHTQPKVRTTSKPANERLATTATTLD